MFVENIPREVLSDRSGFGRVGGDIKTIHGGDIPMRPDRVRRMAAHAAAIAVALIFALASSAMPLGAEASWSPARSIEHDGGAHESFNTGALEGCPFVGPDDRTMFIASNREGGLGGIDIWMSTRDSADDPWSAPVNVGAPVNSSANDFCPTIARDGHDFFFVSERQGGCGGGDIYSARLRNDTGFEDVRNLGCEVNSPADEASPFPLPLSGQGVVLFFSSTRAGGFSPDSPGAVAGDGDLYYATRHAGVFGSPALVPGVNTAAVEGQPNVRRDGLELFFFSTRSGGFGMADLYSASRSRTADEWAPPVNLGANVNSEWMETRPSLSWDASTLYFGSSRPGEGSSDIYSTQR